MAVQGSDTALSTEVSGRAMAKMFKDQQTRMESLLQGRMPFLQVCSLAMESLNKVPRLRECTPDSIVNAVLQACVGAFRIGGPCPQAHLVPFNNKRGERYVMEAQLVLDYRGVIAAICRGGVVTKVQPRSVYEGDHFRVVYGTDERIEHEPEFNAEKRGHIIAYYVVFTLADGSTKFDVMTTPEVERIRAMSKVPDGPGWSKHPEQMGWKTILKRGAKTIQVDYDTQRALAAEDMTPAEVGRVDTIPADFRVGDSKQQELVQEPKRVLPVDDPQRGELLKEIKRLEMEHPGAFASAMQGAPPLDEQEVSGLRMTLKAIQGAATAQAAGKGD